MAERETRQAIRMARVLRVAGIRRLEATGSSLMERAGSAVASMAITMAADVAGPIVVLAGPGNNGGDALVAARELHRRGIDVVVALLDDEARYAGDALAAWNAWTDVAGTTARTSDPVAAFTRASLIVDGLFGIGFARAPEGRARAWIEAVNTARCPVLAIDIPSGVDADTGRVADIAIVADRTISFIGRKPGLHTGDGVDHCGEVVVDLLGLEGDEPTFDVGDLGALDRPALFTHAWKPRRLNSHKGTYGSVAVVGGHAGMVGAALLAARTALHSGAGRVYVRLLAKHAPGFDVMQPELMLRSSLDGVGANAYAIGPGLGSDDAAIASLEQGLATPHALVLDADALNLVARDAGLAARLADRPAQGLPPAVLTPHPLEAARLLGVNVHEVQRDRIASATTLARRLGSVVILKGAGSIVVDPSGVWVINPTGNPALATGGTGDVLCGLVAGLLAQGMPPLDAARAATWVHGSAADQLVNKGIGPVGLVASELIPAIRTVLNRL